MRPHTHRRWNIIWRRTENLHYHFYPQSFWLFLLQRTTTKRARRVTLNDCWISSPVRRVLGRLLEIPAGILKLQMNRRALRNRVSSGEMERISDLLHRRRVRRRRWRRWWWMKTEKWVIPARSLVASTNSSHFLISHHLFSVSFLILLFFSLCIMLDLIFTFSHFNFELTVSTLT